MSPRANRLPKPVMPTPRTRSSMVVPRGTAPRMEEDDGLAELEAALAMCLHPPPSSGEEPTIKRAPMSRVPDTITSPDALPVFARQAPVLVTEEPRPMVRTVLMAPQRRTPVPAAPPLPAPPGTTLTMNGPAPWMAQPIPTPPPMAAVVRTPSPVAPLAPMPVRRRSRVWLVAIFLLAAFLAALASSPPLRVRTRGVAATAGTAAAHGAKALHQRARHAF